MSLNEVHISSLVVHAVPEYLSTIKRQIEAFAGAEIYGESAAGKLVVVIETQNQGYITDTIDAINQLEHVLSTALVFHQIETDLDALDAEIETETETEVESVVAANH